MWIEDGKLCEVKNSEIKKGHFEVPESVTEIGSFAFDDCRPRLKSVTIPDSVTEISDFAFGGCYHLTNIIVDKNNPYYSSEDGVLFNKRKTKLIKCPAGKYLNYIVPEGVTLIGNHAFFNCTSLESVTIGNSVTEIGDGAFAYCDSLKSVMIPDSVTKIGAYAFEEWTHIQKTEKQPEVKSPTKKGRCR